MAGRETLQIKLIIFYLVGVIYALSVQLICKQTFNYSKIMKKEKQQPHLVEVVDDDEKDLAVNMAWHVDRKQTAAMEFISFSSLSHNLTLGSMWNSFRFVTNC